MEPELSRPWYKKKRYIAPLMLGVAFTALGALGDTPPAAVPVVDTPVLEPASPMAEPASPSVTEAVKEVPKETQAAAPATRPARAIPPAPDRECHPSYSGCLNPDASDYDCAGGSGDGPYYTGAVRVFGPDVYGLDRDHDGYACE